MRMSNLTEAAHEPIVFWQEETPWTIPGALQDSDGSPLDLTSASVAWVMEDFDGNIIRQCGIGTGITVEGDPAQGNILITVSGDIPLGRYWDKLDLTISGATKRLWSGQINFREQILVEGDYTFSGQDIEASFGIDPNGRQSG
jgi:hypothetical protein